MFIILAAHQIIQCQSHNSCAVGAKENSRLSILGPQPETELLFIKFDINSDSYQCRISKDFSFLVIRFTNRKIKRR